MSRPTIVLKFGGSVLTDPEACRTAVHEIYRYHRMGHAVVAVCSAFKGETDDLLGTARLLVEDPDAVATAALLRTGELRSSACLAIASDAAGLRATLLDPEQIGLLTEGPLLDAHPVSVNVSVIRSALECTGVAIVPGFTGRNEKGQVTLLGRGGSDLTALFLADALNANCRLVKDVSGWYDAGGASASRSLYDRSNRPPVFHRLNIDDACERGDSVVQQKAVAFATRSRTPFGLGLPGSARITSVDTMQSTLSEDECCIEPLRVVILGVGTVGAGVWRNLSCADSDFVVVSGLVGNADTERPPWIPQHLLTTDASSLPEHDLLIEALPDAVSAFNIVRSALRKGTSVVSANKDLIARHGPELHALAFVTGAPLRYASAIGGACPVLETAELATRSGNVTSVRAVLNATSNFVLDRIRDGDTLSEAIVEAQRRGYAESDPTTDLSGRDAANKLVLLCHQLTGHWLHPDEIPIESITADIGPSNCVRQVAEISLDPISPPHAIQGAARVTLQNVDPDDPLFGVNGDWNAAIFQTSDGATYTAYGRGAGRWPTAEAVVADAFDVRRSLLTNDILVEAS